MHSRASCLSPFPFDRINGWQGAQINVCWIYFESFAFDKPVVNSFFVTISTFLLWGDDAPSYHFRPTYRPECASVLFQDERRKGGISGFQFVRLGRR